MHDGILQLAGQYDAEISIEGVGAVALLGQCCVLNFNFGLCAGAKKQHNCRKKNRQPCTCCTEVGF